MNPLRHLLPCLVIAFGSTGLLLGCAHGTRTVVPETRAEATRVDPVESPHPDPVDPCGLGARPQLSAEEHMRIYGCPPCPCACVDGQLRCAPCVACRPNDGDLRPSLGPASE